MTPQLNEFALDLYENLREQEGNLFLSPFNISTSLAMAYAGAGGETERQMAQVLRFPPQAEQGHAALGGLLRDLNTRGQTKPLELVVANALWGQKGYHFRPEFVQLLRSSYDTEVKEVDFGSEPEAAERAINQWTAEQTREKITEIIPRGFLGTLTRLILTSAIYFKGKWELRFREEVTHPARFIRKSGALGGDQVDVSMMAQTEDFPYMETRDFQAMEMPYKGGELSMVIFLPRDIDGLEKFEKSLTSDKLTQWMKMLQETEVEVYVPRFKMTSTFQLGGVLRSMGLTDAFDSDTADFSGMTDMEELYLFEAVHKAYVDVTEEGTEAAAVTGAIAGALALEPEKLVFRANHPFFFLIRDLRSESILFMGRVADPEKFE